MVRRHYFSALLFVLISSCLIAQQGVHGPRVVGAANTIVNEYTSLTASVAAGSNSITVANSALNANGRFPTNLLPGDLIMIYQVQGVFFLHGAFVGPTDTTWGKIPNPWDYQQCGLYEFAQVQSVPNATTIILDCGLTWSYNHDLAPAPNFNMLEKTIVVRVPRYTSLTINAGGVLTCDDWNGTTGGILAVEVQGTTTINAGGIIDATGKGFRGGSLVGDNATTFGVNTTYSTNNTLGAEKGEGVAGYQAELDIFGGRYCRAPAVNGGGGGDAHNAGGGGGANAPNSTSGTAIWSGNGVPDQSVAGWGTAWSIEPPAGTMNLRTTANSAGGGRGGYSFSSSNQNATAIPPGNGAWAGDARNHQATGLGGRPLSNMNGRVYFGGGGGAGDQNQLGGGVGGDGGGLIYIMCFGTISGSGTVTSNGANGANSVGGTGGNGGIDGAGGGGGGGSVILNAIGGVAGTITITTNGGAGGNQVVSPVFTTNEAEGPGGGGGGGYIAVSSGVPIRNSNGGNNGTTNSQALTEFLPNGATRGCPGTNNALVLNYDITLTNQTICAGQTATITPTITGSTPPGYVVNWYNASTGGPPFFTGASYTTPILGVGTYTYWVGTCGGFWRESVTITVVGAPTVTSSASANPICSGQSTTLTAAGTSTSYVWNPGNIAGASIVVTPPTGTTTYTVTGTLMPGGCTNTSVITVTVNPTPTVTATASTLTICNGQSTTLTGGGATSYVWNPGSLPGSPISVSPTSNTTYTVTGTTGGCSSTAQVAIVVNTTPTVTASAGTNPICSGNSTTLTGGGASTYVWNPGSLPGSPISVSPGSTITYTVTGTAANGCTNTGQITVTVTPTPTVTATASSLTICNGQSTTLTGGGATSYVWNPGSLPGSPISVSPTSNTTYTVTGTTSGCSGTAQVAIVVNATPTVTTSASTNPICAGASTSLSAGGASTYVWNPGSLPGSPVSVSPGSTQTYTVTGTAANGCTSNSQITVTVNPLPTVTSNASINPICIGGSTTLTGGGASTYVWNPGSIPGSPINVAPGATQTYTVTGTDGNGCTNTSQITVTVVPTPTVTATANTNPICAGSPTTLTASGATTYNWNPGNLSGTAITVSPGSTTAYTVTGTSGSCSASFVITVTVNPTPVVSSAATTNPICAGASTSLSASGASTYVWNPGAIPGSPVSVTPASTTTYTVTGTDGNGCTSTSQITVTVNPVPTITATPSSATICAGASTTINMSGAPSYNWMPGALTGSSEVLSPAATTTYTITGTDANGCTNTAQVIVTVNTLPTVTASSAPATICAGQSATLTAGGASTYVWNPGALPGSPISVTPASTTTYTVTGTDGNGCTSTATAMVTVNPLPVPTATATPNTMCMGDTVQLSAGGGTTYTWNGGSLSNASGSTQSDNPAASTTYSVVVTDGNGCVDSTTVAVTVNTLPTADAGLNQTVCAGTTVNMFGNGGITYTWNGGSLSNANGSSQSDTPPVTTDYELMVTDANGCTDLDTVTINVNALPIVGAGPDVQICINSSTLLNGSGASAYVWTPAGSLDDDSIATPTASPAVTTTYVVVGTDGNGCSDDDTVVVTIGNNLTVFASNDITICPGDSALLTIVGGTIWSWSPGATLDQPSNDSTNAFPTSTTTYTVNVQDANGCLGMDSVTVFINSSVSLTATGATTICIGQSASINATPSGGTGPYTYTWDNSLTGPGPHSVSPTVTTTYNVFVTDSIGCNSTTQSIVVTVNPALTLNAINPASACVGGTANLTASGSGGDGNFTYTWYPGAMTGASQTVSVSATQTYTVVLTDGCGTPADTQMVTVIANQPPTVSLTSDVNTSCAPLCANFTGTSSGTCSSVAWNFGDNTTSTQPNPNHCYLAVGTYDVIYTCTDGNGCVGSDTVVGMITVVPNPVASFTIPTTTVQLNGGQATVCVTDQSTGAAVWFWTLVEPSGTQTSTQQNPCFTVTDTGAYQLFLIAESGSGCQDTTVLNFNVEFPCNDLFVPSAFSPNGDGMNDTFYVYGNCISFMQLEIYSRWGEQVFISTTPANGWDGTWRGKECEAAVFTYVLRGQMDDGTPLEMQGNITLTR